MPGYRETGYCCGGWTAMRQSRCLLLMIAFASLLASGAQAATGKEDVPGFVKEFVGEPELKKAGTYSTSFETISEFSGFYIVPQNHKNSASHSLSSERSVTGASSHKAWIFKKNEREANANTNHRAYPTMQMSKTSLGIVKSAVLVELSVWADIDLYSSEDKSWFSLATFTSYYDTEWFRSYLINVDKNYRVHLMHVPTQGESRPDIFSGASIALPRRAWVKISAYIDYTTNNRFKSPFIAVWQDGTLVAASRFSDRVDPFGIRPELRPKCLKSWDEKDVSAAERMCGLKYEGGLAQMHFGMYAPPLLSSGVIYNDDLSVSEVVRN